MTTCLDALRIIDCIQEDGKTIAVFLCSQPCPLRVLGTEDVAFGVGHQGKNTTGIITDTGDILDRAIGIAWITGGAVALFVRIINRDILLSDGGQVALWDDIRTADRQHMTLAFQQRRQQIVGDCRQLKTDVDSYNENGNKGAPLQIVLDFTEDVAELEALEEREVAPTPLVMV